MTYNEIISWVFDDDVKTDARYQGIMIRPYRRRQVVSQQLQDLQTVGADDGKLQAMLRNIGTDTLLDYIDDEEITPNNDDFVKETQSNITSARSLDDLEEVQLNFDNEKNDFEVATITDLQGQIDTKRQQLQATDFTSTFRELSRQVRDATTFADLQSIDTDQIPPGSQRNQIIDMITTKQDALDLTLERQTESEILGEIRSASTLDDLNAINVGRAETAASEARLRDELESRRDEI